MMQFSTTVSRTVSTVLLLGMVGATNAQQVYPNKLIRFITPYAPGGSTSILAQIIGQKLTESWKQQVLVDNRPGGNTIIGTEALAKAPPDGYTIMLTTSSHVILPLLFSVSFDVIKDFSPISTLAMTEQLLVLNPTVAANNLKEFIELAKSKPGQFNYSTGGAGTATHLAGELFNILAGVKIQHIPYKGAGPAVTDLIGGQVQLSFQSSLNVVPYIQSGKLKAIAISGEKRSSATPHVPTFTEAGLQGFDVSFWYGVLAPAGVPKDIVDKLSSELAKILAMSDTKEKLTAQGVEAFSSTPDRFGSLMKTDMARFANVVKTANIKLEN